MATTDYSKVSSSRLRASDEYNLHDLTRLFMIGIPINIHTYIRLIDHEFQTKRTVAQSTNALIIASNSSDVWWSRVVEK